MSDLSLKEKERYKRHLILPNFLEKQQLMLKSAHVVVVGAGGLGSPVILYLAAAGVGNITIVDDDIVESSNLQRQILFSEQDIGKSKSQLAASKAKNLNSNTNVKPISERLNSSNAIGLIKSANMVIDCTDNFDTRYIINDQCVRLKTPFVSGSVFEFEGQCTVFADSNGPCYSCLFPEPPPSYLVQGQNGRLGILGALPGVIGSIQANEAIKILTNIGEPLINKLLTFDSLSCKFNTLEISKRKNCKTCSNPRSK